LLQLIFPLAYSAKKNLLSLSVAAELDNPQTSSLTKPDHILSITGTSYERLETDSIILSISIETLNISLAESYKTNTISSNKVSNVFEALQIPDRNITTKSYKSEKLFRTISFPENKTEIEVFEGFKIVNSIEIRLSSRDLSKILNLIEGLIQAGNVLVNTIKFELSRRMSKLASDTLLKEAARDALERASVTTENLDLTIDDVKRINSNIVEEREEDEGRYKLRSAKKRLIMRGTSRPTIYSGTINLESRVLVDFII